MSQSTSNEKVQLQLVPSDCTYIQIGPENAKKKKSSNHEVG